jgi:hypothetical protein
MVKKKTNKLPDFPYEVDLPVDIKEASLMSREQGKPVWEIEGKIDVQKVLEDYGPEACYQIADKLKEVANIDIMQSELDHLKQKEEAKELSDEYTKQETTGDLRKDCARFIEEVDKIHGMKEPSRYKQWLAGDFHLISEENQKRCLEYHQYLASKK